MEAYRSLVQRIRAGIDDMTNVFDLLEAYDQLIQEDVRACETQADVSLISDCLLIIHLFQPCWVLLDNHTLNHGKTGGNLSQW